MTRKYLFDLNDYMRNDKPLALEYGQAIQTMYSNGRVVAKSRLVRFISRKIRGGLRSRMYNRLGLSQTRINLGSTELGRLKPNRKELKQLRSNRIVYQ